ncbi:Zinc finger and SCAN domain-containing protein 20 [Chelonia mydas]|uniref:Zinc finger and SCAN domain-containing protein 20 n=1 Tax=Chelonia mydas TaxID=8469 RepID=M7AKE4_CHEMY|nr:Zinc finger and SCAN domain-containing protein 20 [Chelonia mydas]
MQSQNRKRVPAWTEREVLDLIAVWGEESVLSELRSKRQNAKTFQKISEAMKDRGYSGDATQCHVKLKELRQVYQKTKESNGCSRTEPQTCCFYAELHAILGGAATTTPPLSVDSDDGVLSAIPEDFVDGEDEEEEEDKIVGLKEGGGLYERLKFGEGGDLALWWAELGHPCLPCQKQRGGTGTGNIQGRPPSSVGEETPEERDASHLLLELGPDSNRCRARDLEGLTELPVS